MFVAVSALVIAPVLMLFTWLEYTRGTPLMMYLTASGSVLVLATLWLLRSPRFSLLAPRITLSFCILIFFTQILEDRGQHTLYWPFVIPVVCMFLFGRREGLVWSTVTLLLTAPAALFPELYGLTDMLGAAEDYIPAYLVITGFSYGYETLNNFAVEDAISKAAALADERDALAATRESLQQTVHELEFARAREQDFAASASDWFFELDEELKVASVSDAWQRSTGLPPERVMDRFVGDFGHFFAPDEREMDVVAELRAGRPVRGVRLDATDDSGQLYHFEFNCRPVRGPDGNIIAYRGTGSDITQQVRAQQELESQQAALFQADKLTAVGQLTSGIAHDFNNLLTVVRGNLDLLRDTAKTDEEREYINYADNAASRAADLTSRMLAFSRRQPLAPKPLTVSHLLGEMVPLLRHAVSPQANLKLDLEPGVWPCLADRAQLESALLNLVINAKDAMSEPGDIVIRVRNLSRESDSLPEAARRQQGQHGDYVCFEVIDQGAGISESDQARIFEPFFTTKGAGKGTGLGLSMVHGFAFQSGGFVEVDSQPGAGTTMRLCLPRTRADAPAVMPKPAESAPAVASQRLLLVEDEASLRKLMKRMLGGLGYDVTAVESAEAALEAVEAVDPEIVCTDIVLKGELSGLDLARRLGDRYRILLMSGYSEEVLESDVQQYPLLRKPFQRDELIRALAQLERSSAAEA